MKPEHEFVATTCTDGFQTLAEATSELAQVQ